MKIFWAALALALSACASTSSVVLPPSSTTAQIAVLPLEGQLGEQASDFISQELAINGIAVVERAKVVPLLAIDTDLNPASPNAVRNFAQYADALHVRYLFVGTVSAVSGPLYSFPHVNITLNLVDARTGQTRWIGRYGNSLWTSAISTQGDMQRGARDIVTEFISSGAARILAE